MSRGSAQSPARTGLPSWAKRAIGGAVLALLLIITYFILAAMIPRWWSHRVESLADGTFTRGIIWGLFFGVVCTAVPLMLFGLAGLNFTKKVRDRPVGRYLAAAFAIGAIIVALPNLMTLAIVAGSGDGAHAGERTLDVSAPGFRGASLVGAIVGVLIFLLVAVLVTQYRRRGKQLRKVKEQQRLADAERTVGSERDVTTAAEEHRKSF